MSNTNTRIVTERPTIPNKAADHSNPEINILSPEHITGSYMYMDTTIFDPDATMKGGARVRAEPTSPDVTRA